MKVNSGCRPTTTRRPPTFSLFSYLFLLPAPRNSSDTQLLIASATILSSPTTTTMSDTEQKTPNKAASSGGAWSDQEKVRTFTSPSLPSADLTLNRSDTSSSSASTQPTPTSSKPRPTYVLPHPPNTWTPSLPFLKTCPVPAGRTALSCRKLILRMKDKHKDDMEKIKNGQPVGTGDGEAPSTPVKAKTPNKRKTKAEADGDAEGSPKKKATPRKKKEVVEEEKGAEGEAEGSPKKKATPRKKKTDIVKEENVEDEEMV
jgi:hypothetical protein